MGPRTSASLSLRKKPRVSIHSAPAQVVEGPPSTTTNNQLFVGKDPNYPNKDDNGYNAFGNYDLENFGYDVSIIAETHYVPADRVGISEERLISSIKHVK